LEFSKLEMLQESSPSKELLGGKRPKPCFISKLAHVTQTLPRIDGSGAHHKEDAAVRASLKVNSVKRNIGGDFQRDWKLGEEQYAGVDHTRQRG